MALRWGTLLLLGLLLAGCSTTRVVRLDTGQGRPVVYTPPSNVKPVPVDEDAFHAVMSQLVLGLHFNLRSEAPPRSRFQLASWEGEDDAPPNTSGRDYRAWCERQDSPRECLTLLGGGLPLLDGQGRRELALSFAWDGVWDGAQDAVRDVTNPLVLKAMITSALAAYMVMLVVPEPVTKVVALALTTYLVAYLGLEVFFNLIDGWQRLTRDSERAVSFDELEDAGRRFGKVMGEDGARVIILALTAAVGGGASNIASKGPLFPGFAQATLAAETNAGIQLSAAMAGGIRSISIAEGSMTVGLAANAVAMSARHPGGGGGTHVQSRLTGQPSRPGPNDKQPENLRSIARENESARTLAEHGYSVEQNPLPPGNGTRPDYRINGEYYDCYAPTTSKPRSIADTLAGKVERGQAERFVLNLDDSAVGLAALRQQLTEWSISGLREVLVVQRGTVHRLFP
ncbi:hypothetical protein [Corallococcus sp. CA053C]|uniref:SitA5 family polymorphic toxin n=1 Tax=Corallococcus sp. CA053C TaxID=2316732 RepID=UPI0011C47ACB|nr:hypothetical protein [Corallococcus sp. CA053C]